MAENRGQTHAEVGARVEALREHRGLSREDLARRAGVTLKALANTETGGLPFQSTLIAIAWALGVEPLALLGVAPEAVQRARDGDSRAFDGVDAPLRARYAGLFPKPEPVEYSGEFRLDVAIVVTGPDRAAITAALRDRLREAAAHLAKLQVYEPLPETLDDRGDAAAAPA